MRICVLLNLLNMLRETIQFEAVRCILSLFPNELNTCTFKIQACADPEGGGVGGQDSPENHKIIGFLSNTGLDPLKKNKATKLAFNVEPSSSRQRNAI